jgi:hypothetical protein
VSFNLTRSRAVRLLAAALEGRIVDRARLARGLAVPAETVDRFLSAETPMPLDRQLLLASIVIEKAPAGSELARAAHRLRAQVTAAMSFQSQETPRHLTAPVPPFR